VFSKRPLPRGAIGLLRDLSRSVLGPKYSGKALRKALQEELGDRRMSDALHPVVVPAVDVDLCQTKVFKTPHVPASQGDGEVLAVSPDQVALHEIEHFMGVPPQRVRMPSIGTATAHTSRRPASRPGKEGMPHLRWRKPWRRSAA
jgi:hypothetical protein